MDCPTEIKKLRSYCGKAYLHLSGYSVLFFFKNFGSKNKLSNSLIFQSVQFFRIIVGLQSPERATSTRSVLRRFSDFLKLFSDVSLYSLELFCKNILDLKIERP